MSTLNVMEIVPAGQALLDIANNIFEGFDEVSELRFTPFVLPADKLAAFLPDTGVIIIDVGNAIKDCGWMFHGATHIPNAWFNVLFSMFHERAHLRQIREDAMLAGLEHATEIMEAAANAEAHSALLAWAQNDPTIPTLDEMGFMGEYIKEYFNENYAEFPDDILRELELQGTNVVAVTMHDDGRIIYQRTRAFMNAVIGRATNKNPEEDVAQDREDEMSMVTSA